MKKMATRISPEEQVTIVDHVDYKNLYTDGREYTVKGKLMDKETGEPLLVDGQEVTAEKTFVPENQMERFLYHSPSKLPLWLEKLLSYLKIY